MTGTITVVGQLLMLFGFIAAVGAQIMGFFKIGKQEPAYAVFALFIPGFLLYCLWRSEYKMPRILRVWVLGFVAFVVGLFVMSLASEM